MSADDEIQRLRAELGTPGMTAGEFAALLPERLRERYWHVKIGEFFDSQGITDEETR